VLLMDSEKEAGKKFPKVNFTALIRGQRGLIVAGPIMPQIVEIGISTN